MALLFISFSLKLIQWHSRRLMRWGRPLAAGPTNRPGSPAARGLRSLQNMALRTMKRVLQIVILAFILSLHVPAGGGLQQNVLTYRIVDTGVTEFYDNTSIIPRPERGESFYGQDAQYRINSPSYNDNGDGTVTDNVTGLMWQKAMGEKMTFAEACPR
jgi:hypothetical protein